MRRSLIILIFFLGFNLIAENRVSITTKSDRVFADIEINPEEYIVLKEQFLSIEVNSDHYDFQFEGYPEPDLEMNEKFYYSDKLRLEGKLNLRDGIKPGDYDIEVVLGFQTCDKDGYTNIPVKIYQNITVVNNNLLSLPLIVSVTAVVLVLLLIILIRRKKFE